MNEHVMAALLETASFFETCTVDECDLDLAVKQLEGMADHLRVRPSTPPSALSCECVVA
jgi:hypothetical protein